MLKRDIINEISEQMDEAVLKKDVARSVDIILHAMEEALVRERRIEIRGFGCLRVRRRKPKTTKNPKTGKTMNIPARKNVLFTMSKSLKEALIGLDGD